MKVAFHDWNKEMPAKYVKSYDHAKKLNEDGYGIYETVNEFQELRRETHLVKLKYFYVEFDDKDKLSQAQRLKYFLQPTKIIESKAGYHVYWAIEDDLVSDWGIEKAIVIYKNIEKNLVAYLKADQGVKDVARVLRVPGFLHQKDPNDPYEIKYIYSSKMRYLSHSFFACIPEIRKRKKVHHKRNMEASGDFWDKVHELDIEEGLNRISGAHELDGDIVKVENNQIWVNDKPTANWIDEDGYIGSHGGGGPNLGTWIKWYTDCWGETKKILCKYFPELEEE